ncbi:hypothetical protein D3C78_1144210 [compost metagenome]
MGLKNLKNLKYPKNLRDIVIQRVQKPASLESMQLCINFQAYYKALSKLIEEGGEKLGANLGQYENNKPPNS